MTGGSVLGVMTLLLLLVRTVTCCKIPSCLLKIADHHPFHRLSPPYGRHSCTAEHAPTMLDGLPHTPSHPPPSTCSQEVSDCVKLQRETVTLVQTNYKS